MNRVTRSSGVAALFFALCLVLCAASCQAPEPSGPAPEAWVQIRTARVGVELAETAPEQSLGLGSRDHLDWDRGMLFLYDEAAQYGFWMKRMRFSIDIIWILNDRIIDLDENVHFVPGSNGPTVRPSGVVNRVLEVPAGYASAMGWRIGDRVEVEFLR